MISSDIPRKQKTSIQNFQDYVKYRVKSKTVNGELPMEKHIKIFVLKNYFIPNSYFMNIS